MLSEVLVLLIAELALSMTDIRDPKYRKQQLMTMVGNTIICRISVTDLNCSGDRDDISWKL